MGISRGKYLQVKKMGITTGRQVQKKSMPQYPASFQSLQDMMNLEQYKGMADRMKDLEESNDSNSHPGSNSRDHSRDRDSVRDYLGVTKPFFSPDTSQVLEVREGVTAYLPCQVYNRNNFSVSWIRNVQRQNQQNKL